MGQTIVDALREEKEALSIINRLVSRPTEATKLQQWQKRISGKLVFKTLQIVVLCTWDPSIRHIALQSLLVLIRQRDTGRDALRAQKDCHALGSLVLHEQNYVLRILAADVIREACIPKADRETFWPKGESRRLYEQFPLADNADSRWLRRCVDYIGDIEKSSVAHKTGPTPVFRTAVFGTTTSSLSDEDGNIMTVITDCINILVPAGREPYLRTISLPLHPDMIYRGSPLTSPTSSEDVGRQNRVTITYKPDSGYQVTRGVKTAIDSVHLIFADAADEERFLDVMYRQINRLPKRRASEESAIESSLQPSALAQAQQIDVHVIDATWGTEDDECFATTSRQSSVSDDASRSNPPSSHPMQVDKDTLLAPTSSSQSSIMTKVQVAGDLDSQTPVDYKAGQSLVRRKSVAVVEVADEGKGSGTESLSVSRISLQAIEKQSRHNMLPLLSDADDEAQTSQLVTVARKGLNLSHRQDADHHLEDLPPDNLYLSNHKADDKARRSGKIQASGSKLQGPAQGLRSQRQSGGHHSPGLAATTPARRSKPQSKQSTKHNSASMQPAQELGKSSPKPVMAIKTKSLGKEDDLGASLSKADPPRLKRPSQATSGVAGEKDIDWDQDLRHEEEEPPPLKKPKTTKHSTPALTKAKAGTAKAAPPQKKVPAKKGKTVFKHIAKSTSVSKQVTTIATTRSRRPGASKSPRYVEDSESGGEGCDEGRRAPKEEPQSRADQVQDNVKKANADVAHAPVEDDDLPPGKKRKAKQVLPDRDVAQVRTKPSQVLVDDSQSQRRKKSTDEPLRLDDNKQQGFADIVLPVVAGSLQDKGDLMGPVHDTEAAREPTANLERDSMEVEIVTDSYPKEQIPLEGSEPLKTHFAASLNSFLEMADKANPEVQQPTQIGSTETFIASINAAVAKPSNRPSPERRAQKTDQANKPRSGNPTRRKSPSTKPETNTKSPMGPPPGISVKSNTPENGTAFRAAMNDTVASQPDEVRAAAKKSSQTNIRIRLPTAEPALADEDIGSELFGGDDCGTGPVDLAQLAVTKNDILDPELGVKAPSDLARLPRRDTQRDLNLDERAPLAVTTTPVELAPVLKTPERLHNGTATEVTAVKLDAPESSNSATLQPKARPFQTHGQLAKRPEEPQAKISNRGSTSGSRVDALSTLATQEALWMRSDKPSNLNANRLYKNVGLVHWTPSGPGYQGLTSPVQRSRHSLPAMGSLAARNHDDNQMTKSLPNLRQQLKKVRAAFPTSFFDDRGEGNEEGILVHDETTSEQKRLPVERQSLTSATCVSLRSDIVENGSHRPQPRQRPHVSSLQSQVRVSLPSSITDEQGTASDEENLAPDESEASERFDDSEYLETDSPNFPGAERALSTASMRPLRKKLFENRPLFAAPSKANPTTAMAGPATVKKIDRLPRDSGTWDDLVTQAHPNAATEIDSQLLRRPAMMQLEDTTLFGRRMAPKRKLAEHEEIVTHRQLVHGSIVAGRKGNEQDMTEIQSSAAPVTVRCINASLHSEPPELNNPNPLRFYEHYPRFYLPTSKKPEKPRREVVWNHRQKGRTPGHLLTVDADRTLVNDEDTAMLQKSRTGQIECDSRNESTGSFDTSTPSRPPTRRRVEESHQDDKEMRRDPLEESRQSLRDTLREITDNMLLRLETEEKAVEFQVQKYASGADRVLEGLTQVWNEIMQQKKLELSAQIHNLHNELSKSVATAKEASRRVRSSPRPEHIIKFIATRRVLLTGRIQQLTDSERILEPNEGADDVEDGQEVRAEARS